MATKRKRMSLDVYLQMPNPKHEAWQKRKQESLDEAESMKGLLPLIEQYYADREPDQWDTMFEANITHNLGKMAEEAGIYQALWRPEEIRATRAKDIVGKIALGLDVMEADPDHFKKFDAVNGWGTYSDFIPWIKNYLAACQDYPEAIIRVSR